MILAKAGQDFELTINSKQKYFGVENFNVKTINLADGSVSQTNVSVTEVIEAVDSPATATVAEEAPKGTKTIKVSDDSTLTDGMVFKDENGNMYYIESVDSGTIKVRKELVADIAYNSTLTQVGNTGIYKIPVNIPNPGKYNVVISNPSIDLRNLAAFVEVVQYTTDDLGTKIEDSTNYLDGKIEEIKQAINTSDDSDFEVVG